MVNVVTMFSTTLARSINDNHHTGSIALVWIAHRSNGNDGIATDLVKVGCHILGPTNFGEVIPFLGCASRKVTLHR